ncbi:hypothetical protein CYMTET_16294 [Cymbomonas tetramitiformis]|uniref:Uncharacterized protein n=1 Tax=Cymbomonas tetramitiformis TaxID=36881 RepID=A0AAE0GCK4_9CHLO|nr:hypothetical protein CYMTET_16294 [Cymbomonas tetramitiformis]
MGAPRDTGGTVCLVGTRSTPPGNSSVGTVTRAAKPAGARTPDTAPGKDAGSGRFRLTAPVISVGPPGSHNPDDNDPIVRMSALLEKIDYAFQYGEKLLKLLRTHDFE